MRKVSAICAFDNIDAFTAKISISQIIIRILSLLALLPVCIVASAGDYVIFDGSVYLDGSTDGAYGSSLPGISTFNPQTCIWTGTSGGKFKNEKGYYLYKNSNGWAQISASNSTNCTISGNTMRISTSDYQYLYRTNGYWDLASKSTSALKCVYSVVTDNAHIDGSSVDPTISGDKTFTTKGESYTFSKGTSASYIPGYIDYIFYNNTHHYFTTDKKTALAAAPTSSEEFDYTWSLSNNANGYVSVNSATGVVTYDKIYPTDTQVTLTLTATSKESKKVLTATKQITFKASTVSPTAVSITSATPMTVYVGQTNNISYSLTPTTCYDNVLFESANTSIATVDANGVVTGVSAGSTTVTVKAMKYNSTESVSATVTVNVLNKVATPVVSFNEDGKFTISCATAGATIHYTTNGNTPTASDATIGNNVQSSASVAIETVVKAIAVLDGYVTSDVASNQFLKSGTSGSSVILNDYEDHNWTYYQKSDNLPSGYPTDFLSSPNPRNVKITYKGNGQLANGTAVTSVRVGIDDRNTETFIYYKTIENNDGYKYTTIPNPFSIRPKVDNTYYGFSHWKISSVVGGTISGKSVGSTVNAETEITFVPSGTYTPNCTSMEVVFEAVWDVAEVQTGNTSFSNNYGVERMFRVITSDANSNITADSKACTYTSIYPNGTTNGTTNATMSDRKYRYGGFTASADSKFEYIILRNNSSVINGTGHNLTIGRGVSGYNGGLCASNIHGCSNSQTSNHFDNFNFSLRIESGTFTNVHFIGNLSSGLVPKGAKNHVSVILGNDYDRANNNNSNLNVATYVRMSNYVHYSNQDPSSEVLNVICKSGKFNSGTTDASTTISGGADMALYLGENVGTYLKGKRNLIVEGGDLMCIAGGTDASNNTDETNVFVRIKGGVIRGSIYGAAQRLAASGHRNFVITGGTINGWVAGGCNGTDAENGIMDGKSFIYIGGNSHVVPNSYNRIIGSSRGGNVFGAGSGIEGGTTVGQVTHSDIVVADNAEIGNNVFGGGNYGYVNEGTNHGSNMFILGGNVKGSVFGGSNQQQGQTVNIYMDNGVVGSGIYGGSNEKGDINNNVTIQINGGQVGTISKAANIHGGGYGQSTVVKGNVDITLGATGSEADADGVTVHGDVYGGSALGSVNGTKAADTYHTKVTLNAGTVHGSLYGGALGSKKGTNGATSDVAANVYGPVTVTVNGGKVVGENSAVYGCNNINGAPQRAVSVIVNGTDSHNNNGTANDFSDDTYAINAVYGGGNQAAYTYGIPTVTVNNCDNSIGYVYGGGNQATVPATNVTIHGGNVIGNVFGGGNNAAVTGTGVADNNKGTRVNIFGGRILNVYGGNNNGGAITGTIKVDVAESAEGCGVNIDDLYGGGNLAASNAGKITIGKCTNINRVFGGANQANVTGPINLSIVNGNIGTVFGGNNNSGTITGAINVTVNWDGTENRSLGSVYGGGNLAEYKGGNPTVNILNGTLTGSVFGGGYGKTAVVEGNPTVNIGDWNGAHSATVGGNVFGGGDLAAVEGNPTVTIRDCGTTIQGDLYGGGNAAPVYSTNTTMWGGNVMGNVFGGGNGADATKNAKGAQVGYKRDDTTAAPAGTVVEGKVDVGDAVTCIYGGTIGTWEEVDGVKTCTSGGGIFGASNTNGNITGQVKLTLDQQKCTETDAEECTLVLKEVYGSGNEAAYSGTGIVFNLGCVDALDEIYGGAKNADMDGDIHLKITSGHFSRVFGGNNLGGDINGSIKVTVDETGCYPVTIDELYGCGNNAAYTTRSGKADPVVNIVSCTSVGKVFGGGYGSAATVTGNPTVNINMIPGKFVPGTQDDTNTTELGTVGEVYGGGNAAKVIGNTSVNIGTLAKVKRADETQADADVKGANILGNVYGGGREADVTGKTNVVIGR